MKFTDKFTDEELTEWSNELAREIDREIMDDIHGQVKSKHHRGHLTAQHGRLILPNGAINIALGIIDY